MLTPAFAAIALVLKPRSPSNSRMRALASRMTLTVSRDLAWPGTLRACTVFLPGLPLPSRTRVLFVSICSYCKGGGKQYARQKVVNNLDGSEIGPQWPSASTFELITALEQVFL